MKKKNLGLRHARIQRGALGVVTFAELEDEDRAYWKQQTPQARLRAMELLRQINYGKAASGRLQRLLEVVQSEAR